MAGKLLRGGNGEGGEFLKLQFLERNCSQSLASDPSCPRAIGIHQASFILHEDALPIH